MLKLFYCIYRIGISNTVSLVKIENLTTGEILSLNGTDILTLKGNAVITGIDDKNIKLGP